MSFSSRFSLTVPLIFSLLFFSALSQAAPPEPSQWKEYEGEILLIDPETGAIGILSEDPKGGEDQKIALMVDPKSVTVEGYDGKEISFADIRPGDQVDISTNLDAEGNETVFEIRDHNRFSAE